MRLRDFNTLTFDVVGTLIDFETGILEWFRPALRRYGAAHTDEERVRAAGVLQPVLQPGWYTLVRNGHKIPSHTPKTA